MARRRLLVGLTMLAPIAWLVPARRARADDETFRYRGREYAPTGSHVTRRLVWSSKLPFDRTYAELTPAQHAWIRDQYDGLARDEEPPFPKDGLQAVLRRIDERVDQSTPRLDPGPLVAVAKVNAQGEVESVAVYKSPHSFVTGAISAALLATPFKPARRNDAPIAMSFLLSVELN